MKRLMGGVLVLGLAALLTGPLPAGDDKKPDKKVEKKVEKKPAKGKEPYSSLFLFSKKITLSAKQQEDLDALRKEFAPKLVDLDKKQGDIMPKERVQAAQKAAKKAYDDALKLTKEEAKDLAEINKSRSTLLKEVNTKKMDLLTDDQKEALKPKPKPKKAASSGD